MERTITGFHRDDAGDWVADLSCGHRQHVRHRPPFQRREWVESPEGRRARIGTPIECPYCDEGGDPACWAERVCERCGAIAEEPGHDAACGRAGGA